MQTSLNGQKFLIMDSQENKKIKYQNLFIYSSEQFCGNNEKYFSQHTEKLVVFVIQPRLKNAGNKLRLYKKGKLVEEINVILSQNIFLYYSLWYVTYIKALFHYFSYNENFFVISFHPLNSFGMTFVRLFRKVEIIYWIGDYFPSNGNFPIYLFEKLKKFYHSKLKYACYLSDSINKIMNGEVINTENKKTIMWGVDPKYTKKLPPRDDKNRAILFIGQINSDQGLNYFINFLKQNKNYSLKIIGVCQKQLFIDLQLLIKKNLVTNQVFFPNRFFSDSEIHEIAKNCHVGIALYSTSKYVSSFYADPGKVKAYAELGLPIIMSKTTAISEYIEKFKAGEVIDHLNTENINKALLSILNNYKSYLNGLIRFNKYFYYEDYYRRKFKFLEKI